MPDLAGFDINITLTDAAQGWVAYPVRSSAIPATFAPPAPAPAATPAGPPVQRRARTRALSSAQTRTPIPAKGATGKAAPTCAC
jgi:hypothetical protein